MAWLWGQEVKERVRQLYLGQNKQLKYVIEVVNREFRMDAKPRTYQKYLKLWGFVKETGHRSRQESSRIDSHRRNTRSATVGPRGPHHASRNATDVSESTSSSEGRLVPAVPPDFDPRALARDDAIDSMHCDYDSTILEVAGILGSYLPHDQRPAGAVFACSVLGTAGPEYSMEDSIFQGHDVATESPRARNSTSACESAGIGASAARCTVPETSLFFDPVADHMVMDLPRRAKQAMMVYLHTHSMSPKDYVELYDQTLRKLQDSSHESHETEYADIVPFEILLQELSVQDDELLLFCSLVGGSNIGLDTLSHFFKTSQESKNLPDIIPLPLGYLHLFPNQPMQFTNSPGAGVDCSVAKLSRYQLISHNNRYNTITIEGSIHNWLLVRNQLSQRLSLVRRMIVQVGNSMYLGCTSSKEDWEFARLATSYFAALKETILRYQRSEMSFWDRESLRAVVLIADAARRLGANKESKIILENVLPLLKRVLDNQDSLTLDTMNTLSVIYISTQAWREAEALLRKLIGIRKQSSDINERSYATELSNWARALVKLARHEEATEVLDMIVERGKHVFGRDEVLVHRSKLAETFRFCGRLMQAKGLLLSVLKDSKILLGESHPRTLRVLELLCHVHYDLAEWTQAELESSELVRLSESALGALQTDTVRRIKFHRRVSLRKGKSKE